MSPSWYSLSQEQVLEEVGSSRDGLSPSEAEERRRRYGPNELTSRGGASPLILLARQFINPLVAILIIAAAVSFGVWLAEGGATELADALVILAIVFINASLGFYQEFKAERTLEALKELTSPTVTVLREGEEREVPSKQLVPGDIMVLATGDRISADARLIEAHSLETVEASLTGESAPVAKDPEEVLPEGAAVGDRRNMVHSGTIVGRGRGTAVVVATGMSTELGKIAGLVREREEGTPLQKKLARLSAQLGAVVLVIAGIIFLVGLYENVPLLEMFLTAVSLAVAAIPEGLPAVVTVCLALGLGRMARRNAVVRRLPAVESLGSATVICTDKTGTLTTGEMSVTEVALINRTLRVTGKGYSPIGELRDGDRRAEARDELAWLVRAGALCNDSQLVEEGAWTVRGDTTEGTLLVLAAKAGEDLEALRSRYPRVGEVPFDPVSKRMLTVHDLDGRRYVFGKGATESLLPLCASAMVDGEVREMTPELRRRVLAQDQEMASRALRVLALAMKEGPGSWEEELTFLGLVGMIDSPRPEAVTAIERCHTAGIRVIMITGDHERTAEAIARQMGIGAGAKAISGQELEAMTREELRSRVKGTNVFARVSPEHKVRIVEALKDNGHVVAMTGDGVNDAPALKMADIGVAMGITGTDVAKESADMVLTDDDFASIAGAVEEGRGIYDNIRRFVVYLLSCNAGEIALIFLATVIFTEPAFLPFLLPIQILWVNLITDSFPALALGVEPIDPKVMERCPRDPAEGPVTGSTALRVVAIAAAMAAAGLLAFQLAFDASTDVERARTAAFCTLVLAQLFMAFSFRSDRSSVLRTGVRGNPRLLYAVAGSLALQLAVVYLPVLSDVFRTAPLGWEWLFIVPLALAGLITNEAAKYLYGRGHRDEVCEVRADGD